MKLFTASLTFLLLAVASASFGSIEKELEIPLLAHHFPVLDRVITNKHFIPNAHRSKRSIISDPLEFIEDKFVVVKSSVGNLAEGAGNGIKNGFKSVKDKVEGIVKRDVLENVKAETREMEGKMEGGVEAVKGKLIKVIR